MQAAAIASRPAVNPTPTAAPTCHTLFRIGFVTDVAGLRSSGGAEGWRGVKDGVRSLHCARADLTISSRPSEYRQHLQAYAEAGYQLVIAASFLLTDAALDVARTNLQTHVLLVDPLVLPPDQPNLAVLSFREDEAGFLAGALAAMTTRSGTVAGVYGPPGSGYRVGFEHGVRYASQAVTVLAANQIDGVPYANPAWGRAQAGAFLKQGADVVFGVGGTTGQGALAAAAEAGRFCIGADVDGSTPEAACAMIGKRVNQALEIVVAEAAGGRWPSGQRRLGLTDGALGWTRLTSDQAAIQQRLETIAGLLAKGQLETGG